MPTESLLVVIGVVGAFVVFAGILGFADLYASGKRSS